MRQLQLKAKRLNDDYPIHCEHCKLKQHGREDNSVNWDNGRTHRQFDDIYFCENFPDGDLPEQFSDCIDLPEICKSCDQNYECHINADGEPEVDHIAAHSCFNKQPVSIPREELISIQELIVKAEYESNDNPFDSSLRIAREKITELLKGVA